MNAHIKSRTDIATRSISSFSPDILIRTHTYLDGPADGPASAKRVVDNKRNPMLLGKRFKLRKTRDVVLLV